MMILKNFFPLNDPKYYCNNCNNKKNMYNTSYTVSKKSDCPSNDKDYSYDIK